MIRRLLLMRHAKSSWDAPELADHDRPLNQRGRLAAALMGAWVRDRGWIPDLAYVSSAARTQETWALMGLESPAETVPRLYHAEAGDLLDVARGAPDSASTVLILGHMPTMQEAANRLLGRSEVSEFPTAKIVGVGTTGPWDALGRHAIELIAEVSPKDLV